MSKIIRDIHLKLKVLHIINCNSVYQEICKFIEDHNSINKPHISSEKLPQKFTIKDIFSIVLREYPIPELEKLDNIITSTFPTVLNYYCTNDEELKILYNKHLDDVNKEIEKLTKLNAESKHRRETEYYPKYGQNMERYPHGTMYLDDICFHEFYIPPPCEPYETFKEKYISNNAIVKNIELLVKFSQVGFKLTSKQLRKIWYNILPTDEYDGTDEDTERDNELPAIGIFELLDEFEKNCKGNLSEKIIPGYEKIMKILNK